MITHNHRQPHPRQTLSRSVACILHSSLGPVRRSWARTDLVHLVGATWGREGTEATLVYVDQQDSRVAAAHQRSARTYVTGEVVGMQERDPVAQLDERMQPGISARRPDRSGGR